ncbi:MAG TPA: carboxypeptidase regulatory-like domain-containing protein [Candidatus Sulfotelmatobacter sp.]|nr:carboxypeptidase regulatory-like domain-containing protein [Candidatus Sulfotelmatobacter sp.]
MNAKFVGLCISMLLAVPIPAQQPTKVSVIIGVTDPAGDAIPGAKICIEPVPDDLAATMRADATGKLDILLPPGSYTLSVRALSFRTAKARIEVPASGDPQRLGVILQISTGSGPVLPDSQFLRVSANSCREDLVFTPTEFKTLPHVSITVHNPHADADEKYSGVALADLLAKVNAPLGKELLGAALKQYFVAAGSDGYQVVLSLPEIAPEFHSGKVIVADAMNGQPLDAKSGPFKLIVTEDKRPARWVRNLVSLELRSIQ